MRPRLVMLTVMLVGGPLASLLCVWGVVLWSPDGAIYEVLEDPGRWRGPGPAEWPTRPHAVFGAARPSFGVNWYLALWDPGAANGTKHSELTIEAGVPFKSLIAFKRAGAGRLNSGWDYGLEIPEWLAPAYQLERALPYRPIWSGLLLNALVFVVLARIAFAVPVHWRQWRGNRRARMGRCRVCGHQVISRASCPECGHVESGARSA